MRAVNPVLARELTQRMRGRQAWLVLVGYLALLAVVLRLVYAAVGSSSTFSGSPDVLAAATTGRAIFHWLLFFMLGLVCFIVPGVTAGAVAGERERQTLVSLQVTLLRPRAIVLGKLGASLAYVLLLVVATLPLVGVSFVLGGVGLGEVAAGMGMVVATAMVLACLALACSALFHRTQGATVFAYGLTAGLVVGTLVLYGAVAAVDLGRSGGPSPAVLALNPFIATADAVRGHSQDRSLPSPFVAFQDLIGWEDDLGDVVFNVDSRLADGPVPEARAFIGPVNGIVEGFPDGFAREPKRVAGLRVWVAGALCFFVLALCALVLAERRVTVPTSSPA